VLQIPSQSAALLTSLMLRGPQTAGELRINTERLHRFADISAVEAFLQELAARPAGALVLQAPSTSPSLEARVARLEEEVAALKALLKPQSGSEPEFLIGL
jgi:uncharacterized protein YceH (UPF0502 family)